MYYGLVTTKEDKNIKLIIPNVQTVTHNSICGCYGEIASEIDTDNGEIWVIKSEEEPKLFSNLQQGTINLIDQFMLKPVKKEAFEQRIADIELVLSELYIGGIQ